MKKLIEFFTSSGEEEVLNSAQGKPGFTTTNRETEVLTSAVEVWIVEWTSRHGKYHGDIKKRYQPFTDKGEAKKFAESLRQAHKLIGNTSYEANVEVYKQNNGL